MRVEARQLTEEQKADLAKLSNVPQSTVSMRGKTVFPCLSELVDLGLAKTLYPITPYGYFHAVLTSEGMRLKKEMESWP